MGQRVSGSRVGGRVLKYDTYRGEEWSKLRAFHFFRGGGGCLGPPKTESGPSKTVLGPLTFGVRPPKTEPAPPP